jgi:NAD-dependent SIR2 family protein deacetylase
MEAYCVKCKAKKQMKDPTETKVGAKGGGTRPAMQGKCPDCGTKMMRFLPKK